MSQPKPVPRMFGPHEARGPGLGDGLLEDLRAVRELPADVDVRALHVVREARDHDPLDQLVGILVHDVAVLEGARLRLVGVHHKIDRLAALSVDERELGAAGESCAAPAPQARLLHLVDQLLGLPKDGLPQDLVAAVAQVAGDVARVPGLVDVPEDESVLLGCGHGVQRVPAAARSSDLIVSERARAPSPRRPSRGARRRS